MGGRKPIGYLHPRGKPGSWVHVVVMLYSKHSECSPLIGKTHPTAWMCKLTREMAPGPDRQDPAARHATPSCVFPFSFQLHQHNTPSLFTAFRFYDNHPAGESLGGARRLDSLTNQSGYQESGSRCRRQVKPGKPGSIVARIASRPSNVVNARLPPADGSRHKALRRPRDPLPLGTRPASHRPAQN